MQVVDAGKIAIVLPDLRGGGAERVAVNLANAFVESGIAVDLVMLSERGDFLSLLDRRVRMVDLGALRVRGAILPLKKYLRETRPDALLACMWPLTVAAVIARAFAGTKTRVVLSEHTNWSAAMRSMSRFQKFMLKISIRWLFPLADSVVAVSRGAADDLARLGGLESERINVIYNPLVPSAVRPVCADELAVLEPAGWWNAECRRVLAVGNLLEVKDYPTLLHAFANLLKRMPARLMILGEGQCRNELEQLAIQLGIDDYVEMPGFVKDPSPYFSHADLHVLSSKIEGFGNVIVEALAAGTPVVSTDCRSGPSEILDNGRFGKLVPVGDAVALAEAMLLALSEPRNSAILRSRAREFSIEVGADGYLELLMPKSLRDTDA